MLVHYSYGTPYPKYEFMVIISKILLRALLSGFNRSTRANFSVKQERWLHPMMNTTTILKMTLLIMNLLITLVNATLHLCFYLLL